MVRFKKYVPKTRSEAIQILLANNRKSRAVEIPNQNDAVSATLDSVTSEGPSNGLSKNIKVVPTEKCGDTYTNENADVQMGNHGNDMETGSNLKDAVSADTLDSATSEGPSNGLCQDTIILGEKWNDLLLMDGVQVYDGIEIEVKNNYVETYDGNVDLQISNHLDIETNNFDVDNITDTEVVISSSLPLTSPLSALCNEEVHDVVPRVSGSRKIKERSKLRRVKGKTYDGYKIIDGRVVTKEHRLNRVMKSRCVHTLLPKKITSSTFMCSAVNEAARKHEFSYFWNLKTWDEKKVYVRSMTSTVNVKKRRKPKPNNTTTEENMIANENSNEQHARSIVKKNLRHVIHFPLEDRDTMVRVCRNFFLNTLALGEDSFKRWTLAKHETAHINNQQEVPNEIWEAQQTPQSQLGEKKLPNRFKKKQEDIKSVKDWFDELPKVPSHYCRSSSSKIYVESIFLSYIDLHDTYRKWCGDQQRPIASRTLFNEIRMQEKIDIHKPRKDQCDLCKAHDFGNIGDDEYNKHIARKKAARSEKNIAKQLALKSDTFLAITMDLQSVLLAPKTLASSMYYKLKLQLHNFTIYSLNDKSVTLYVWHEGNGGVSANEFTTCLLHYIQSLPDSYKSILLISDGCAAQNRNKVLSSALSDVAVGKNLSIEQLILTKGHSMMEADTVHRMLEDLFQPPIYSPMDYYSRMRVARPNQPFDVRVVEFNFFVNYEAQISNLASLRPGKRAGDPVVTDLCKLKYNADGTIEYKTNFEESWNELPQRRVVPKVPFSTLQPLYSSPIKIKYSKYKDLQSLKSVIEKDHHSFYDNLPYHEQEIDEGHSKKATTGNAKKNGKIIKKRKNSK